MAANDANERKLISKLGGHAKAARTLDPAAATAQARMAFLSRFEQQVDPDGVLDAATRGRLADAKRREHFTRLALKSAQARRARRVADEMEAEVAAELAELGEIA